MFKKYTYTYDLSVWEYLSLPNIILSFSCFVRPQQCSKKCNFNVWKSGKEPRNYSFYYSICKPWAPNLVFNHWVQLGCTLRCLVSEHVNVGVDCSRKS